MSWYVIKGLSPAFDGLLVESDLEFEDNRYVKRIVNRSIMLGDRELSYSIPQGGLIIRKMFLEDLEDPELRQFDSKNPWGKFICEGRTSRNSIEVAWAEYELCITVTVMETNAINSNKTLYSENFILGDNLNGFEVTDLIRDKVRDDETMEDLIFSLKELKNRG